MTNYPVKSVSLERRSLNMKSLISFLILLASLTGPRSFAKGFTAPLPYALCIGHYNHCTYACPIRAGEGAFCIRLQGQCEPQYPRLIGFMDWGVAYLVGADLGLVCKQVGKWPKVTNMDAARRY